jgi:hypothetical protein
MFLIVHSAIAEVEAADKGDLLVDTNDLLVVAPEERATGCTAVWVTNEVYQWAAALQRHLCMHAIKRQG